MPTSTIDVAFPDGYIGSIGSQANSVIDSMSEIAFLVVGVILGFYLLTKVISLVTKHIRA